MSFRRSAPVSRRSIEQPLHVRPGVEPIEQQKVPESVYCVRPVSEAELLCLEAQDRLLTAVGGAPLGPGFRSRGFADVLDLGSGTGGWARFVGRHFPAARVVGIDREQTLVAFASNRAAREGLTNVSFEVGDFLAPLPFPGQSFDVVNGRLIDLYLTASTWTLVLDQTNRVLRPGGTARLEEFEWMTNSPATEELYGLFAQAAARTGQSFSPTGRTLGGGMMVGGLLERAGFVHVAQTASLIDFSAGRREHSALRENWLSFAGSVAPFIAEMGLASVAELRALCEASASETEHRGFRGIVILVTAAGRIPPR
jgi:SAM-dependent methyltransferase